MNRRFLALALAGTLSLSLLAGCGSSKEPAPESSAPVVESPSASPEASPSPVLPTDSPAALPETTPPAEETPSQAPSAAPSAKPSAPAATPKPTQKPTSTPTPEPVEPEPQVDAVQSTWNDISKLDIPSLTDLDDATLTALYGIDPADLDSYLCKMPMVNVQATEFFIAKVKDGKMDTVKAAVEKRQDDLEAQWSQYLPEQLELVQNYKLVTNGNYILFAVSEYAGEAVTAFNTYTK